MKPTRKGHRRAGPLSPLLSNILLDDLDKELERRGHRFCRYADDCNIYVKSKAAGERVMESITRFLAEEATLKGEPREERSGTALEPEIPGVYDDVAQEPEAQGVTENR